MSSYLEQTFSGSPDSLLDVVVPPRPADCVRVVSYNVYHAAPMKSPEPFGRVLKVLAPDVVMVQEWDECDGGEIQDWFRRHVPSPGGWNVRTSAGRGVAIASPHPLRRLGPYRLDYPAAAAESVTDRKYFGPWISMVGAVVDAAPGPFGVVTVHLTATAVEGADFERLAEAEAVNKVLRVRHAPLHLVGGDLNLVGSDEPLQMLRNRLETNGADFELLEPNILGGRDRYTWRDARTHFPLGVLDHLVFSARAAELVQTFVLDTARMTESSLHRSGLQRLDTGYSDHLPLVADFRLQRDDPGAG